MNSKRRGRWWLLLLGCAVLLEGGGDIQAQREGNRAAAPAEADSELETRTYQVSPTFLDSGGGDGAAANDPFASDTDGDGKALRRRPEAELILERAGVHFGKGASAVYQPDSSLLVVCNTPDQLQLVVAFVEALAPVPSVHLHIKATFVTSRERLFGEQEGLPEPKVSGPENATYNIEEPGDLVKLLEQTNLSNAVANARSRVFQPRTQMAGGTPVAVLTTDEVEARFKKLRQAGQAMIIDGTGGRLASGSGSLLIHADDRGVGIASGVVAADHSHVSLEIVSQGPQIEGQGERRLTTTSIVIADGRTVVLERRLADELYEYDFITARILDAAGNPVHASGEQEEAAAESAGSPAVEEAVDLPSAADLYTNVYQVPPTFLDQGVGSSGNDPFASGEEKGSAQKRRPTARELLERAGVEFPEEGSALYDPSSSQLIVRNTLDQMELVEAYIESTVKQVERHVYVTTLFAESDEALFDPPAERAAESNRGKVRSLPLESSEDLAALLAAENIAVAMEENTLTHLLPGVSGVFTDPQLKLLRKRFAEQESTTLSGGGSVMLRSGQGGWLLAAGDRAVGVKDVVIGADGFTIELSLYFQGGAARGKGKREVNEVSITIWDGQTVMVERELSKGRFQYDFVTARLKDATGQNINGDEFPAQEVPDVEPPTALVPEEQSIEDLRRIEEADQADQAALRGNQQVADEDGAAIEAKLKNIILPSVEFTDTPLPAALEFLAQKSAELDIDELDPARKGINFILQLGSGGFANDVSNTLITLKLSNVPLVEAVRYTTSLAQLKYKVEPHAVVVVPMSTPNTDLYTNVYQVPPNFLSSRGGDAPVDPIAAGADALTRKPTAIEILSGVGIVFPEGTSAIYGPSTSQLIVRNTLDQMELVEAYVESLVNQVKMQVHVTTWFVETDEPILLAEQALNPDDTAKGKDRSTSRSLVVGSSEDLAALLAEKDLVEAVKKHTVANLESVISGVFTDQQMAMVRGKLAKRESASVIEGGSAMLRSGKGQVLLVARDRAVGLKEVVIGLDGSTVDLSLYSQGPLIEGAARRHVNEFSLTIWDGQTVAVERALPDGHYQYDFITARLIGPAGLMARAGENVIDSAGASTDQEADAGAADPGSDEVRRVEQADQAALRGNPTLAEEDYAAIEAKLKNIILPSVEFIDTPLRAALEFLTQKSAELDVDEPDPAKKGINFILQTGSGGAAPAPAPPAADPDAPIFAPALDGPVGGGFGGDVGDTLITLKLSNVPLVEAVRYTTALAMLKYKVEPHAVVVVPSYTPDADLYTNAYPVPPDFLSSVADLAPIDPFAPANDALKPKPTAIEVLRRVGIVFPEGASAVYNPSTSKLVVRNTLDQMELVEAYIESILEQGKMQVYVTTLFAETDGPLFPEQALVPDDTAMGTGHPTSRSLVVGSSEDLAALLAERDLVEAVKKHTVTNLKSEIGGVFTDQQLAVIRGMLAKRESTSVVEGANAMLRSGQGHVLLAAGERAVGVKEVVIGMDGFTVDLSLYSQGPLIEGAARRDVNEISLTIWDGQTVAVERALPDGRYQYDFITARLLDPAGMPFHGGGSEIDAAGASASEEKDAGAANPSIDEARRVEKADQAALRGNQQMADEDYATAQASFLEALKLLPDIDLVEDREKAFLQQFLRAMREARKDGGE